MNEIENALSHIENFQYIHEHLLTSGQPSPTELQTIKEYGVSTVINLALDRCIQSYRAMKTAFAWI